MTRSVMLDCARDVLGTVSNNNVTIGSKQREMRREGYDRDNMSLILD